VSWTNRKVKASDVGQHQEGRKDEHSARIPRSAGHRNPREKELGSYLSQGVGVTASKEATLDRDGREKEGNKRKKREGAVVGLSVKKPELPRDGLSFEKPGWGRHETHEAKGKGEKVICGSPIQVVLRKRMRTGGRTGEEKWGGAGGMGNWNQKQGTCESGPMVHDNSTVRKAAGKTSGRTIAWRGLGLREQANQPFTQAAFLTKAPNTPKRSKKVNGRNE